MTRRFVANARQVATAAGFAAICVLVGGTSGAAESLEEVTATGKTLGMLAGGVAARAQRSNFQTVVASEPHLTAQLQALPEAQLKDMYSTCSRQAMERVLGSGEAAGCSIVYETLLRSVFGGDFEALLLWSRFHPDLAIEAVSGGATASRNYRPSPRN